MRVQNDAAARQVTRIAFIKLNIFFAFASYGMCAHVEHANQNGERHIQRQLRLYCKYWVQPWDMCAPWTDLATDSDDGPDMELTKLRQSMMTVLMMGT